MRYNIDETILIKSENAAKSYKQPNKHLMNKLIDLKNIDKALDYGCGKGRYTVCLCNTANRVDALDSSIQISRKQIIWGKKTTLLEWSNSIQNLNVFSVEEFNWEAAQYDFILNSNVLSAIPEEDDRIKLLQNIRQLLKNNGKALITTQYRNSYFNTFEFNPKAFKHNDGWIVNNNGNYSFYGIIDKSKILTYFSIVGLQVIDISTHDGSVYATVGK